jgi:hypothetical protein
VPCFTALKRGVNEMKMHQHLAGSQADMGATSIIESTVRKYLVLVEKEFN